MATDTTAVNSGEAKAQWNVAETNALLAHLLQNISEARDGRNFKTSTFTSAAATLLSANLLTAGPPKTNRCCRNKWNSNYHNVSGAHWDNVHGAGINGEAAREVFNNYVSSSTSRSSLQQFSNSGWIFYDMLAQILPSGTGAQGNNAFTPAVAAAPVLPEDVEPEVEDVVAAAATVIVSAECSSAHPVTTKSAINFTAPRLPITAPSTLASSISTGKCTHDDALADLDTMSHTSTHPSLTGPMASTTLISEPPPAKKS
ncbi:hypothetical protein BDR07DRAFT_1488798 [Suillus spraguei]|nr:hypothetical protein BDR07DRAFT_1488798 [Suillus spraguei]